MSRFALDGHTLALSGGGNRSYVLGLLEGLVASRWRGELVLYVADPAGDREGSAGDPLPPSARRCLEEAAGGGEPTIIVRHLRSRGPVGRLAREFPGRLSRDRIEAALFQYVGPVRPRCPVVLAVHDPSFVLAPGRLGWRLSVRMWLTTLPAMHRAAAVIVPSEWTAAVLRSRFPRLGDRLHVAPLAPAARFRPDAEGDDPRSRRALGLPDRYLLYVGRRERRKNVPLLLDAYAEAVAGDPGLPPLFLFGPRSDRDAALRRRLDRAGLGGRIVVRDGVPDEALPALYRGAELFCFPGLCEGFGLPVIEAMACGCPVLASDDGALPETVGEAGLLLPPHDPSRWAGEIVGLGRDGDRRREMARRGVERSSRRTWADHARETISVLERAAERRPDG